MLGCPLSIGSHIYLNLTKDWKKAFELFLSHIEIQKDIHNINVIQLRDFNWYDKYLEDIIPQYGFVKTDMPSSYELRLKGEYLNELKSSQRYYVKKRAQKKEHLFQVLTATKEVNIEELYQLYLNVAKRSYELNLFTYPKSLFEFAVHSDNWEIITLRLNGSREVVAMAVCNFSKHTYNFLLAGLNYDYVNDYDTYNQLLYQIVNRSIKKQCKKVQFGLTTAHNKRKFGAEETALHAYIQINDTFNMNFISQIGLTENQSKKVKAIRTVKTLNVCER